MTDPDALTQLLKQQIATAVDSAVQQHVVDFIEQMALDPEWVQKIEVLVTHNVTERLGQQISGVDLNTMMAGWIDAALARWKELLMANFRSTGIEDRAQSTQLTLTDDVAVFNSPVSTTGLLVEQDADVQGTVSVNDLVVRGTVNGDAPAWQTLADDVTRRAVNQMTNQWREVLVQQVLDLARERGIDFDSILVQGFPLFVGDRLNPTITKTNITKLGTLEDLVVAGKIDVMETLSVRPKRLGINTAEPDAALNLWDEEVSISLGKYEKNMALIGTSRKQGLALGINRNPVVRIDETGLTTIPKLRIDRWMISHATQVPGYEGVRGDFVLNSDPKPNQPFAWVCLGGARWQSLKAAT